jgi:hypothetical protein
MTRFAILNQIAAQSHSFHHGETVQYFRTGEHTPYSYKALVTRVNEQILTQLGFQVGQEAMPSFIVDIRLTADKTKGITPGEVNTDFDQISLPVHVTDEPTPRQVQSILRTEGGRIHLLVA